MIALKDILFSLQYDIKRNGWLRKGKDSPFVGHVLMFHHVTDELVDTNPSCLCRLADFQKVIENYRNEGYEFVSIAQALEYIRKNIDNKFVVITFDDIPDNVFLNAYPYLKVLNIPFTVFITVGYIGNGDYITPEHLKLLNNERLCTIGAHTMTHPMLRLVKNSEWEISQSKIQLEQIIEKPVEFFAYPYGRFSSISSKVKKQVQKAGFKCAFCTVSSPLTQVSSRDSFFLPRFVPQVDKINEFYTEWTFIGTLRSFLLQPIKWFLRH